MGTPTCGSKRVSPVARTLRRRAPLCLDESKFFWRGRPVSVNSIYQLFHVEHGEDHATGLKSRPSSRRSSKYRAHHGAPYSHKCLCSDGFPATFRRMKHPDDKKATYHKPYKGEMGKPVKKATGKDIKTSDGDDRTNMLGSGGARRSGETVSDQKSKNRSARDTARKYNK